MIDHDGIPLVRKDFMSNGVALNLNGISEARKLFQDVQDIIQHYPMEFTVRVVR